MINKFTLVSSKLIQLKVYKTKQIGNKNVLTLQCSKVKRQHKDMTYWNWGPTTICHNIESEAFF